MAPIVSENIETAQQLLKFCEVRHIPTAYLGTTVIDGKHLFQLKKPPIDQEKLEIMPYFENTFYTNDAEYVEKTRNMLNDIWKSARTPSAITLETITKMNATTIDPLSDTTVRRTLKKIKGPLFFKEDEITGRLTEKDVLNKIIDAQKLAIKGATPKDRITRYGTTGHAVIHPPEYLNLPDIMIGINHFEKHYPYGAEDNIIVMLWLETPKGYAFVPGALVGDNPETMEVWKACFAGIPLENYQLVKKDQLQIWMHGNTLFAGWTVPIPLIPPYILPPSCIFLEGYGNLKTNTFSAIHPSGYKVKYEYNGFEAFVTFMHPSSKYTGPGTDGFLFRDYLSTAYLPSSS